MTNPKLTLTAIVALSLFNSIASGEDIEPSAEMPCDDPIDGDSDWEEEMEADKARRHNRMQELMQLPINKSKKEKVDRRIYGVLNHLAQRCAIRTTNGNFAGEWQISFRVDDPANTGGLTPNVTVIYQPALLENPNADLAGRPLFDTYFINGVKHRRLIDSRNIDVGVYDCIHSMMSDLVAVHKTTRIDGVYWDYSLMMKF